MEKQLCQFTSSSSAEPGTGSGSRAIVAEQDWGRRLLTFKGRSLCLTTKSNFSLASIPYPKRVLLMLLLPVSSQWATQPRPSNSNPDINEFRHQCSATSRLSPSTNACPPVGPLEMSRSEHDDLGPPRAPYLAWPIAVRRSVRVAIARPIHSGATVCSSRL